VDYLFKNIIKGDVEMSDNDSKIHCPKCGKMIVPNVTKYGCGGGATQRICPLCGKRIGGPTGMAWCFIATAAFGSSLDNRVQILCDYRDNHLEKTIFGRMFIKCYYFVSPSIAHFISRSEKLRAIVRFFLAPIISYAENINRSK
jgi:hypothetical protein